jgi:hypothetical protein
VWVTAKVAAALASDSARLSTIGNDQYRRMLSKKRHKRAAYGATGPSH